MSVLPQPKPPFVLLPENQCKGVTPATRMLNSDLLLQEKFAPDPAFPWKWQPSAAPTFPFSMGPITAEEVKELREYLQDRETNLLVPSPQSSKEESDWDFSLSGPSRSTEDGGVSIKNRRDIREYLKSGYTRKNPNGTHEIDNDLGGKWEDGFTIFEGNAKKIYFDVSAAEGGFSNEVFSGKGSVLNANAETSAGFELTNKALKAHADAGIQGSFLDGSVQTNGDHAIGADASGSVVSGDAEAKAEMVLSPEQATLSGKLGAEVNLIEGEIGGQLNITPKRIIDPAIDLWNWAVDDDVEPLSDNWDIGITAGVKLSGQVGAQASAEGKIEYKNGRAIAEAGIKGGLGLGGGIKASGGIVGMDKILNLFSD